MSGHWSKSLCSKGGWVTFSANFTKTGVQVADVSHEKFKSSRVMRWWLSRLSSRFGAKSSRERKPKWLPGLCTTVVHFQMCAVYMLLLPLILLSFKVCCGQNVLGDNSKEESEDVSDWIDPTDMINYDLVTGKMRNVEVCVIWNELLTASYLVIA